MADELSFEEFRAIESRGRSKKRAREAKAAEGDGDPLVSPDEAFSGPKADKSRRKPSGAGTGTGSLLSRLGVFLEMHEMQAAVCILLLLDSFAAFYAASGVFADDSSVFFDIWHRGLKSFSTFSLFFFVIEMSANILAFNFSIVGHIGYLVDAIVVAWQVYFESEGASKAYKLLNIFRLWRLLRLFLSMLDIEREEHDQTRGALGRTQRELEEARDKLRLVEDDIEREKVTLPSYRSNVYMPSPSTNDMRYDAGGERRRRGHASELQGRGRHS